MRQDTILKTNTTLRKVREEKSATVTKLQTEYCRQLRVMTNGLLLFLHFQDSRRKNDNETDTLIKLRLVHEDGRKVMAEAHVAEWSDI